MTRRAPLAVAVGRPVVLADVPADIATLVADSFAARRLPAPVATAVVSLDAADDVVAGAWLAPTPSAAAALAPIARTAAAAGRPLVVWARPGTRVEEIAAVAYLRAAGAAVCAEPDAWVEALALLAAHGTPAGARTAVVAPPDSYLAASAHDDGRRTAWSSAADQLGPTDVVLLGRGAWSAPPGELVALRVPLCERGESLADAPVGALVGLRPALAAIAAVGRAVERARIGLGPAARASRGELEIDEERLARQLGKIAAGDRRLGDHEAKVLLAAYGVPITRQAVATSPSAAQRLAAKAGFPVDLKPWGPDVPSERAGCPIERGLASAADVRRAFTAVLAQAGQPLDGGAVIVRASPRPGRALRVKIATLPDLGPTVIVEVTGQPPEAAPAPLRLADANALALTVVATRAGDDEPDRVGLANLLRRASHLAVDHADRLAEISLGEVVVAGKGDGAVVVDAEIALRP